MRMNQRFILLEKSYYPFRRWPKEGRKTLLFPGCGFAAQFPQTMVRLEQRCTAHGIAVAHDCCGKPVAELERVKTTDRLTRKLTARLDRLGVEEVVVLCPNCMEYLSKILCRPVISVYQLLGRWGVAHAAPPPGMLFLPCPDRSTRAMLGEIAACMPLDGLTELKKVPCCGLRGDIAAQGPQTGDKLCALAGGQMGEGPLYVYCASCAGQFARHGLAPVRHLLSVLLDVEESPDYTRSIQNRMHL